MHPMIEQIAARLSRLGVIYSDLTYDEASAILNISHRTVRRLVKEGKLEAVRHSHKEINVTLASISRYRQSLSIGRNV